MNTKPCLIYLAAPYSHPDPDIVDQRLRAVTRLAFELTKQGLIVYSPLTHLVPIANLGMTGGWEQWKTHTHCMLSRSDKLLIYKLPGWQDSKGLQDEIQFAKKLGIPIEEIECHDFLENKENC